MAGFHKSTAARSGFWGRMLERLQDPFGQEDPSGPRDPVGFSIALLSLCAKIAKADGRITTDEVRTVRAILHIDPRDERAAGRVFDLCGENARGYEAYAGKLARAIGSTSQAGVLKADVLDALFHVALADGEFHPQEELALRRIAEIFEISDAEYRAVEARHVPDRWSPENILGLPAGADETLVRRRWKDLVFETHPDRMIARGMPAEMVEIAGRRLQDINRAYEELRERNFCPSPA